LPVQTNNTSAMPQHSHMVQLDVGRLAYRWRK